MPCSSLPRSFPPSRCCCPWLFAISPGLQLPVHNNTNNSDVNDNPHGQQRFTHPFQTSCRSNARLRVCKKAISDSSRATTQVGRSLPASARCLRPTITHLKAAGSTTPPSWLPVCTLRAAQTFAPRWQGLESTQPRRRTSTPLPALPSIAKLLSTL